MNFAFDFIAPNQICARVRLGENRLRNNVASSAFVRKAFSFFIHEHGAVESGIGNIGDDAGQRIAGRIHLNVPHIDKLCSDVFCRYDTVALRSLQTSCFIFCAVFRVVLTAADLQRF